MNTPLLIGVTGGIGAGKSIICRMFGALGVPVYDADLAARHLMEIDPQIKKKIETSFGPMSYLGNILNRPYLAQTVFSDPIRLSQLNDIVHPAVKGDFWQWIDNHSQHSYLVKEAALLFETGSYRDLDQIILVTAPTDLRIRRVISRDTHRSDKEVRDIIDKQWIDEKKISRAQHVIVNDGKHPVLETVLRLHDLFRTNSKM